MPRASWRMAFVHVADRCWDFFAYHLHSLVKHAGVAFFDAPVDALAQQVDEIDRLLREGIDVLAFRAARVDDAPLLTVLARARAQGVYLISVDGLPGGAFDVCSVSADNFGGQAKLAQHVFEKLGGRARIAYVQGDPRCDAGRLRDAGLRNVLARYPRVELAYCDAFDWSGRTRNFAQGEAIANAALDAHADLDAILCATDDGALGVNAVLERRGLRGRVLVSGFDAMPQGVCAVHAGDIAVSARQPLDAMAQKVFELARQMIADGRERVEHHLLPVDLVTRDNAGAAALGALRVFPGIVADRNERAEAQKSNAVFLETLLDAMPTMICVKEPRGLRYVRCNRAREAWFGVPRGQQLGRSGHDYYPPEVAARHDNEEYEVLRSGATLDIAEEESCGDFGSERGRVRYTRTRKIAIRDASGQPDALMIITEDVTPQTLARQALAERSRELERTRVALRKNHERLAEAEKMAALGALVAGVSHELNTPIGNALMAASTYADATHALRDGLAIGLKRSTLERYLADAAQGLALLERNLRRSGQLIQSFKQIAVDQGSSQARVFSLASVVGETVTTLAARLRNTPYAIVEDIPDDIVLDSFPGALEQVLINLINNALVHGFAGRAHGTIRIAARRLSPAAGESVELTVHDDGVGIADELIRRIYDPFFSTRFGHGGSGLGLGIVSQLVTGVLGGQIDVASTPGGGTRFSLRLPLRARRSSDG